MKSRKIKRGNLPVHNAVMQGTLFGASKPLGSFLDNWREYADDKFRANGISQEVSDCFYSYLKSILRARGGAGIDDHDIARLVARVIWMKSAQGYEDIEIEEQIGQAAGKNRLAFDDIENLEQERDLRQLHGEKLKRGNGTSGKLHEF